MIRFCDSKLTGAPPLLSEVVRPGGKRMGTAKVARLTKLQAVIGSVIAAVVGAVAAAFGFAAWAMSQRQPGRHKWDGIDLVELAVLSAVYAMGGLVAGAALGGIVTICGDGPRRRLPLGIAGTVLLAGGVLLLAWAYSVFAVSQPNSPAMPSMGTFFAALAANGLGGAGGALGLAGIAAAITTRRRAATDHEPEQG